MADTKLSALTADAEITGTELVYVVDDPAGTPTSKKTTVGDLKTFMGIPVKATGAEVNTGTDDAKFVTAKAMKDSDYVKNPMTTAGDVIYGGVSGAQTRLGIGTANQVLTVNAGATAPEWKNITGGGGNLFFTFQLEGVTPNGTYPLFTSPVAGTIVKYYWTSDILPVGSARTRDIRKNGTATTDSINTSDTPLSIATNQSATNGKYTVSTDVIDNGAVVAGTVLYDVFAGGSTSGTANDCITIEIEPS